MKVLLVSSHGDPKNSKLWSGTPANLCKALEGRHVVDVGLANPALQVGVAHPPT